MDLDPIHPSRTLAKLETNSARDCINVLLRVVKGWAVKGGTSRADPSPMYNFRKS